MRRVVSPLYASLMAEAAALLDGSTVAPAANLARHEAGHVVVAWRLGVPVRHTTLLASPCYPDGPHTCTHTDDQQQRAAIKWAGPIVDRSLAWSTHDFQQLGEMGLHRYGPAFDLAERILAECGHEVDQVAAGLADPRNEGCLFAEDIEALLG